MNETLSNTTETTIDRRSLLVRAGLGGAGLMVGNLLAGCGGSSHHSSNNSSSSTTPSDLDVLNFALNLEYLEGAYYAAGVGNQYGLTNVDIEGTANTGAGNPTAGGAIVGGRAVSFSTLAGYFQEIANDEINHIRALRSVISSLGGTPVARPNIDFTDAFNAAGQAANGQPFDPFSSETNFVLGGFLLSDVGVTAYVGGSQFLSAAQVKLAAAKILAVEAYHVGSIRTLINNIGGTAVTTSQQIAAARNTLNAGLSPTIVDQGVGPNTDLNQANVPNIALTDASGLAFGRSTSQVLAEVYLNKATNTASGGFFPNGLNGTIHTV